MCSVSYNAEATGFEPARAFTLLTFQASALDHYATPPESLSYKNILYLSSESSMNHSCLIETNEKQRRVYSPIMRVQFQKALLTGTVNLTDSVQVV